MVNISAIVNFAESDITLPGIAVSVGLRLTATRGAARPTASGHLSRPFTNRRTYEE